MTREQIKYALKPKYKVKEIDKKTRLALYRDIYVACRKLKLSHKDTLHVLHKAITKYNITTPNYENIEDLDVIDEVNTYWPRCAICNKILKIDKRTGDDYCNNKSCSNYLHPIRRP